MKTKLLIPCFLVLCSLGFAQNPTVWMPDLLSYANTTVTMPVIGANLNGIHAISLGIYCDPGATIDTVTDFCNLMTSHPFSIFAGELFVISGYVNPVSVPYDTLFKIQIHYQTGFVPIVFDLYESELGDSTGLPFPTPFTNGSIDLITGIELPQAKTISVYPNPVTGNTTLHFNLSEAGTVECSLLDLFGREIRKIFRDQPPTGQCSMELPMTGISPGTYLVHIKTECSVFVVKVIKTE